MREETKARMMMTAAFVLWVCIQPGDEADMCGILLYGVMAKIAGTLLCLRGDYTGSQKFSTYGSRIFLKTEEYGKGRHMGEMVGAAAGGRTGDHRGLGG